MSVSDVGTAQAARIGGLNRPGLAQNAAFDRLSVGQIVNVHVLRRFDTHRYLLSIDGQRHHVESATTLPVGGKGQATVTAVGERLELRVESMRDPPAGMDETNDVAAQDGAAPAVDARTRQLLTELEGRYRITLEESDRGRLAAVVAGAAHPDAMVRAGLFLNRLGMAILPAAAHSVYAAQVEGGARTAALGALPEIGTLLASLASGDAQAREAVQQLLLESLDDADVGSSAATADPTDTADADAGSAAATMDGGTDPDGHRDEARDQMARWLLNLQDEGAIGHRYGTLPVLVAGQLIELDLVLFRERPRPDGQSAARREPLRRLVMTLNTESFGTLQVVAQAVENRLAIAFTGRSPAQIEALSGYGEEVRRLVGQLGWNVDNVSYGCDPQQRRAAARVVDHVLDAGSIDRVL